MRIVTLSALACLVPAAAQEPVPDTTAPALYWPLEVGNEWEYEDYWGYGGPTQFRRWVLVNDTVVAGTRYFVRDHYSASTGSGWSLSGVSLVRFDSSTTRIVRHRNEGDLALTCQLNAAFWTLLDCYGGEGPGDPPEETMVRGAYADTVRFWRSGQELVVPAVKSYDSFIDAGREIFAATIGYVGREGSCCSGGYVRIRYARVGGVEYGQQIFVTAAPSPVASSLSLQARPNPADGPFEVMLGLPSAGRVLIDAFDALGRRMNQTEVALPAGSHVVPLDAARWPPGLYIVRATAGGVNVSTRVVRR